MLGNLPLNKSSIISKEHVCEGILHNPLRFIIGQLQNMKWNNYGLFPQGSDLGLFHKEGCY